MTIAENPSEIAAQLDPELATDRDKPRSGEQVLRGVAASPGIAIGEAVFRRAFPCQVARRTAGPCDDAAEGARARDAFEKTRNDVARIRDAAARELGEEHAFIFTWHLVMLHDPVLQARIAEAIAVGLTAPAAIDATLGQLADRLRDDGDPYLQERVEDIDDLRGRLIGHLIVRAGGHALGTQIVVSPRIAPSLAMEMKAQGASGIVAQLGGTTSHGVLLARSLGIPAVTGVDRIMKSIEPGDVVILDGSAGTVVVRPTTETRARYEERARNLEHLRTDFARYRHVTPQTCDGVLFSILANVAFGSDLLLAKENGAEGIGLYRTEFPFIVREAFPTREEQVRVYRKAYDSFPNSPITFRILDLAGDKFVAAHGAVAARGAFHGYRSIRVLFDHPHVLRDQVQAFALAAGSRPLRILVPMVTSVEELLRVKHMALEAIDQVVDDTVQRAPQFGAMIEVPAAVEITADLAEHVDFFSIGTNDLIQYTLINDREDPRMTFVTDAYHPAILRMIRRTISAAHHARKPVTVCGEMAARPDLAMALVALGTDALSVAAAAVPELKRALAMARIGPLSERIDDVLACRDGVALQAALRALVPEPTPL
jgi:phosphotransferase system enzyme I (PtsP)